MLKSLACAVLVVGTFFSIGHSAFAGVSGARSSDPNGDVTIRNPRIFMRGLQLQINCNFGDSDTLLCRYAGLGKFVDRETGQMDVSETINNAYLDAKKGGVSVSVYSGNDWPIYDSITCKRSGAAPAKSGKTQPAKPVKKAPAKKPVRSNAAHHSQYEDDSCGHEDDKCTSSVQCCGDGMCHDYDDHGVGKCW